MIAVVFAAIKVYLVQLHCDVSVEVKRPRMYVSGADKNKREKKRRLENVVVQSLFVTTTVGQDGGTKGVVTSTTWTGRRPDARQPDGSRSLPAIDTLQSEVILCRQSFTTVQAAQSTVSYQQREWQHPHVLGNTLPCTLWGYGNRTAMALLLTNDEEAILLVGFRKDPFWVLHYLFYILMICVMYQC